MYDLTIFRDVAQALPYMFRGHGLKRRGDQGNGNPELTTFLRERGLIREKGVGEHRYSMEDGLVSRSEPVMCDEYVRYFQLGGAIPRVIALCKNALLPLDEVITTELDSLDALLTTLKDADRMEETQCKVVARLAPPKSEALSGMDGWPSG
jgi:hypothetical protein